MHSIDFLRSFDNQTMLAAEALSTARNLRRDDVLVQVKLQAEALDIAEASIASARMALVGLDFIVRQERRREDAWLADQMRETGAMRCPPRE